jgi:hypothetical protein
VIEFNSYKMVLSLSGSKINSFPLAAKAFCAEA